jgi:hypothetical protein
MDISAHPSSLGKLQAAASCGELTQVIKEAGNSDCIVKDSLFAGSTLHEIFGT